MVGDAGICATAPFFRQHTRCCTIGICAGARRALRSCALSIVLAAFEGKVEGIVEAVVTATFS